MSKKTKIILITIILAVLAVLGVIVWNNQKDDKKEQLSKNINFSRVEYVNVEDIIFYEMGKNISKEEYILKYCM